MAVKIPRHSWINYPTRNKRKCTRCGCTKENVWDKELKATKTVYHKDGKDCESLPECKNVTLNY